LLQASKPTILADDIAKAIMKTYGSAQQTGINAWKISTMFNARIPV
jgi:hypothetical protein